MGWIETLYKAREILMIILKHFQILDILLIAWWIIGSNFSNDRERKGGKNRASFAGIRSVSFIIFFLDDESSLLVLNQKCIKFDE